jgi:hypothetical protein
VNHSCEDLGWRTVCSVLFKSSSVLDVTRARDQWSRPARSNGWARRRVVHLCMGGRGNLRIHPSCVFSHPRDAKNEWE